MIGCYLTADITGLSFCSIRCLLKMTSPSGEDFDIDKLELKDKLKIVLSSRIYCIVNRVHECTVTCVFRDSTELQTIEREEYPRLALIYDHDNSNNIYSLNKFSYNNYK